MSLVAKEAAARAALAYIQPDTVIGMGTGSTVNALLDLLHNTHPGTLTHAVASSRATHARLEAMGVKVLDLNETTGLDVYIDGADAIDPQGYCLKGGGGAHTQEKVLAQAAKHFVCIADTSKWQKTLSTREVPLVLEVLPVARSWVARQCVVLGARPIYREGARTDHGNVLLDVYDLALHEPLALDATLNGWAGVVGHGLFVRQRAHTICLGDAQGGCKVMSV